MGTLTRAQHHIGLRLMLTIALWGHSLPTSHWVEEVMLTIALWGHSLEPNITLG